MNVAKFQRLAAIVRADPFFVSCQASASEIQAYLLREYGIRATHDDIADVLYGLKCDYGP